MSTSRVFMLLFLVVCWVRSSECAEQPHMIVLLADDLGWGDVGYHGSRIQTPNIDRLAQQGVQLNQFYVQPVCSPTRASLMTGRYPMRYGLQCGVVRPWASYGLPLDERTLPQALSEAGYVTAICGKWHLGHVSRDYLPTRRGFTHQYGHYNGALDYFKHVRDGGYDWHRDDQTIEEEGYTTELIAGEAERLIAAHNQQQPLFLYVPFNAPHTPLQVPDKYLAKYASIANKQRRTYAAMVDCLDESIGRIMTALREHQFPAERTLVFFCSDNGGIPQHGSNRELRAGKGTLYEGGVRVPAIAMWEGVLDAGTIVDQPLHIVDLYPTLLSLAGAQLEQPKPLDGLNAWDAIAHGAPTPHQTILHNLTPFHAAIRAGDWKLIQNGHVGAGAAKPHAQQTWELYHLATDISEKHDVQAENPEVFARLKQQLADYAAQAVEPHIAGNAPPAGFKVPKVWGEDRAGHPPLGGPSDSDARDR